MTATEYQTSNPLRSMDADFVNQHLHQGGIFGDAAVLSLSYPWFYRQILLYTLTNHSKYIYHTKIDLGGSVTLVLLVP